MKSVLLVQPPFERLMGYKRFYTHPGLLSLAAIIEQQGFDVLIYDADYDTHCISYNTQELMDNYDKFIAEMENPISPIWDEIQLVLKTYNPDFLGLTVLTVTQEPARKIARMARALNKDIIILAGGAHPTIQPEDCLDYADYVIQNEGELVITDILNGNYNKGIVKGKRIWNLDTLPFPAVHRLYDLERYDKRDLSMVLSTRGCPCNCKFCSSPLVWNRKTTRKSVSYFIEEIYRLKDIYNVEDFFISDDSFTYDRKWLDDFCEHISMFDITWRCLSRIDLIDSQMLTMMTDAGCRNIKFGIESGSQRILDGVNKHLKIEQILSADEVLKDRNINWSAFFIIGLPGETMEDIRETQELMKKVSARSITLSVFTPYPGSELQAPCRKESKYYSHHSPHNNFTGTMDDDTFRELLNETLALTKSGYVEHL